MKKLARVSFLLFLLVLCRAGYAQDLEVHFINVGQGDSILVKTPDEKIILIDAGKHYASQTYNPIPYLKSQNIDHLDAIIISHPHDDHYGGFKYLCTKQGIKDFPVSAVYYSVEPGAEYGQFEGCLDDIIKRSEKFGQSGR